MNLPFLRNKKNVLIRKPIGPETNEVLRWIRETFSDAWESEARIDLSNAPMSCLRAI